MGQAHVSGPRVGERIATPGLALALGLVVLVVTLAGIAITAIDHSANAGGGGTVLLVPGFGVVGAIIARRQPRNPIGWTMLCAAVFLAFSTVGSAYSVLDYRQHAGSLPLGAAAVVLQPGWAPAVLLVALSLVLYPDGDLPGGRWRVPLGALLISGLVWLGGAYARAFDVIVRHDVRVDPTGNLPQGDLTGGWVWWGVAQGVFFALFAVVGFAWLASQIPAYRRAAGVRRAQLKWLLLGAAAAMAGVMVTVFAVTHSPSAVFIALGWVGTVLIVGLPVGIGIGILRYRLYDIDRLISRTLSYALLTGLLVGVFVGVVLLTTRVLPFSSPVGVAASTLLAAALFAPLRTRVQRVVDQRFNRAHYDAEATVAAFSARLRDAVDPETVLRELSAAASRSLEPSIVMTWTRNDPGTTRL
jgi:hypothetical protein